MEKLELPQHHNALVNVMVLGRPVIMRLCTDDDPPYLVPAEAVFLELNAKNLEYDLTLTDAQIASLEQTDAGVLDSNIVIEGKPIS